VAGARNDVTAGADSREPAAAATGWRKVAAGLLVALAGSLVCRALHTPLPWLIGPLVAVAAVSMLRGGLAPPPAARQLGQWAIGVALGLYFSPEVVREVVRLAPWVAAAVVFAVVLGLAGAALLVRLTAADATTAFFAAAIGGASEMAAQAQRHGGRVERVAAAHSLRIMLVVLIVPVALGLLDVHGLDAYQPLARNFDPMGFAVLVAVTLGAAVVMERSGSPNSWMIGPLVVAAAITASGHTFSSLPVAVVNGDHRAVSAGRPGLRPAAGAGRGPALVDRRRGHHARRHRRDGAHRRCAAARRPDRHCVPRDPHGQRRADGRRGARCVAKMARAGVGSRT
jgi:membrane AbrB-like protein